MGAGKLRFLVRACGAVFLSACGVVLLSACGVVLLSACGAMPSPGPASAAGGGPGRAVPTVSASPVPGLGRLSYGPFPVTADGELALALCEDWAQLRGQYVRLSRADTPYQLEQWFSGAAWAPAFGVSRPLKADPAYSAVSAAFGVVTAGRPAGIGSAGFLDRACAAAD
jgi:hypothetical protein